MSTIVGVIRRPAFQPSTMVVLTRERAKYGRSAKYQLVFHSPAPHLSKHWSAHIEPVASFDNTPPQFWTREVPESVVLDIQALLDAVRINPLQPAAAFGIDGVTYELFTDTAHLQWWVSPPAEWAPCEQLAKTVLALAGVPYEY